MRIIIKDRSQQCLVTLEVESWNTISHIKRRIEASNNIPQVKQRLLYYGMTLKDNLTLSDYNLKDDSVLHVLVIVK